ncbi:hypothetical protein KJ599_08505, partial [bacterium]|nr:hypothetical protein [bacterium]
KSKDQVMYAAHLQYGYTLKDIAEYIGVHYSIESRVIKKTRGKIKSDIARPDPIISFINSQVGGDIEGIKIDKILNCRIDLTPK